MKTKSIDLTADESGLMCNLLYLAMKASGKEFADQPMPVKTLSTKLARCHAKLTGQKLKAAKPSVTSVNEEDLPPEPTDGNKP